MANGGDRQFVWLIRYGRTYPGLVENVGPYDSDLHQPDGVNHAEAIGRRLASSSDAPVAPAVVYSDPFLRCMRTADVIVKTLNVSSCAAVKIRVEEGTTEWQVPSLLVDPDGKRTNPRTMEELAAIFPHTVDASYRSVNAQGPDRGEGATGDEDGRPRFPETENQLHARCATTLKKILAAVGHSDSVAIVGHAPCVQSMAMYLEGSVSPMESKLGPWSLGGMTLFSRPVVTEGGEAGSWKLELYSDTSHMPGEYKAGKLGQWSLPSFVRE